jgi:hypothetical protein
MASQDTSIDRILDLYQRFAHRRIGRREFMRRATALGIGGAAVTALPVLVA